MSKPLNATTNMFVTKSAPATYLRRTDGDDVYTAASKKDADDMAKAIKRSMESDGAKLYAGGLDGSYAAFVNFHRNVETTMEDMHKDMRELLSIHADTEEPKLGYSPTFNKYLFKILWKLTTKEARTIVNAHYTTQDGRRAMISLMLRSNPTDILSKKQVESEIAAIKINGTDPPLLKMEKIKSLGEQLMNVGEHI